MRRHRGIAILVLGAVLAGQALPAHAARMLCSMAEPAPARACDACDPARPVSGPVLFSRDCCRIAPASAAESAPVLVPAARRGGSLESDTGHPASAVSPAALPLIGESGASHTLPAAETAPPPPRPGTRTTVLRN